MMSTTTLRCLSELHVSVVHHRLDDYRRTSPTEFFAIENKLNFRRPDFLISPLSDDLSHMPYISNVTTIAVPVSLVYLITNC